MLTKKEFEKRQAQARELFRKANIILTERESKTIEIADVGLGEFERTGLALVVYVNTKRCCAKELALLPHQTCPEHRHPPVGSDPGKEETFRCRWGKVFVYVPGPTTPDPRAKAPAGREAFYTVWHEIELNPGEQYTLEPNTLHWFQAGPDGAVISEFSTTSRDECDIFTDPSIARATIVK